MMNEGHEKTNKIREEARTLVLQLIEEHSKGREIRDEDELAAAIVEALMGPDHREIE